MALSSLLARDGLRHHPAATATRAAFVRRHAMTMSVSITSPKTA
jgi:hypothetical protein